MKALVVGLLAASILVFAVPTPAAAIGIHVGPRGVGVHVGGGYRRGWHRGGRRFYRHHHVYHRRFHRY